MNDINTAAGRFTDDYFRLVINPNHTGNALVSPLSLLTALTMLLAGARHQTKESLSNALRLPSDFNQDDLDNYYRNIIENFKKNSNDDSQLLLNDMLLVSKSAVSTDPLTTSFESTLKNKYFAEIESADFENQGQQIKNRVNSWVNSTTKGLIPTLLDQPPAADTAMLLLNSLYFQGKWLKFFEHPYTRKFFSDGPSGEKEVKFMSVKTNFNYQEVPFGSANESIQMIEIPYKDNTSMIIFYPPESMSVNSIIKDKSLSDLTRSFTSTRQMRLINLHMPKFKFDTKSSVADHLKTLGAGSLFSPGADLSGINGKTNLHVSSVIHATAIEVFEEGTKAAAVTSIAIALNSYIPPRIEPLFIALERPFAFIIYDKTANLPIFVGKLGDP